MGISFDLEHRHLPTDRHRYPRAPFASLWTQHPEDADRAYDHYRGSMKRSWHHQNPLLDIWGGRPFNAPAVMNTHQYSSSWGDVPGTVDQRVAIVAALSEMNAPEIRLLASVARRKGSVAITNAGYGILNAHAVAVRLVNAGWCEAGETKPSKKQPVPEPALFCGRTDKDLLKWELMRRNWICELMVRYQYAYEATQSSMIDYRTSGVVSFVEVLGEGCCLVCERMNPGRIPVKENVEIPVTGCVNEHGCICCVLPIVDSSA